MDRRNGPVTCPILHMRKWRRHEGKGPVSYRTGMNMDLFQKLHRSLTGQMSAYSVITKKIKSMKINKNQSKKGIKSLPS